MRKGYIYVETEAMHPLEYERWRVMSLEQIAAFGATG
jgi:hypothetical protein